MPEDIRRALAGVEITELFGNGKAIGQLKKVRFAQKCRRWTRWRSIWGGSKTGNGSGAGLHITMMLGSD